jgi:hypothetical protein
MRELNMARVKLALTGKVIYGRDEVRDLLRPKAVWSMTVPSETRLRMLKLKSDRRKEV